MKKRKLPSLVTILVLTVITVVFWLALDIYRALTVKPTPSVSEQILRSLDPNLDEATLNTLQKRVYIEDSLINAIPLQQPIDIVVEEIIAEPTPTIEPTQEPIPSPTPSL